ARGAAADERAARRGRRRRRRELRAPRGALGRRARAARAHAGQRRDDRLGGSLREARPVPRLSWPRCVRLALSRGTHSCSRSSPWPRRSSSSRRRATGRARRRRRPRARPAGVGSRPRVAIGQRVIVVLKTPSLAQRVQRAGGIVGTRTERTWTDAVLAAEKLLVSRLALQGVTLHPDYSYARVLAGFSAMVDSSAIP